MSLWQRYEIDFGPGGGTAAMEARVIEHWMEWRGIAGTPLAACRGGAPRDDRPIELQLTETARRLLPWRGRTEQ